MSNEKYGLLNKNDLKEYLNISVGKIDLMMKNNEIDYFKIGKSVRFDKNSVDKFKIKNK
jgi:excisionase family DNA binding protein|tara:strand:+ start:695 stop:871 length:177 start_codon:yes stop_codon:yes gene_type:complete